MVRTKRFSYFMVLALFFSSIQIQHSDAGLLGPSADTKKCVATLKGLAKPEAKLLSRYGAVTGSNYKDDETTYRALVALVPDVNEFIGRIEAITPKDAKLSKAVSLFAQGWNAQAEGMMLSIAAIETQDYAKAAQANKALAKGRALIRQFSLSFKPFIS